jgi:adenine-specific DNA-methyltransferase
MPAKQKTAKKAAKPIIENPAKAPAPQPTEVKLTAAKGRPMLQWVGKRPLSRVTAFPAQLAETFDPSGELQTASSEQRSGNLYYGDNKEVLAHLLANGYRGKVDLVYIDPPFDSGADYVRKVTLRGKSALAKIEGETYSLGEQVQYTDIWANDNYLQFMYERLILLKELLGEDGTLWLHCDSERGHYLKCMLDEVFGSDNFVNQVVWKRSDAHNDAGQGAKHLGTIHDMILIYRKGTDQKWNTVYLPLPQTTIDNWYRNVEEESGRSYNRADITGPGGPIKGNPVYEWKGVTKAWRFSKDRMAQLDKENRIYYAESGMPYLKRYLDESKGVPIQDWWDDIQMVRGIQRRTDTLYPTEKPELLLERVLKICTNPNDLVLDCFIGSGTTAAVAQKLGRRWIGCDINKGAIQTTSKRLQGIIRGQLAERAKAAEKAKGDLFGGNRAESSVIPPAALSFRIHRVNDYDLAIQHNEAVALACEHIGVTRTKTDAYFDGTQGKRLVKIIPFNHPLSPTDLEQLKQELKAREKDERDILLVCLGKELACESWLTEWGRLRKRGDVPNKIEVVELRTDPKYGKFMSHTPASAKVSVKRKKGELHVSIDDFTSPTIIERLDSQDSRLFKAHVSDWRFMVDCVMIDPAYDGHVFNIALTDLPEKKAELVNGNYTLSAPDGPTTVAVKIIDMLGEEVLIPLEA